MSDRTISVVAALLVLVSIFFGATPAGRATWNNWFHDVQKVDDATRYQTRKEVEETCRAMVASYNSDKLTYNQYSGSEDEERRSWADQAKMRANRTAATYNEYVLKNSYVWEGNIPEDIAFELPVIE